MTEFDDSRLEDAAALARADDLLRRLASAGARVRIEAEKSAGPIASLEPSKPRAIIAVGAEARLVRAMLEPTAPVPFVAWPRHGLPGWVGTLDLVVVMAPDGGSPDLIATVHEAVRRGCSIIIACPPASSIAEYAGSRATTLLPTSTGDSLAVAVQMLGALARMHLGPEVDPQRVADAMDKVAEDCSPFVDLAVNPAKDLALSMADALPLVWGGSVLAARAARRVSEALRAASGRPALAADSGELEIVMDAAMAHDPFADPFLQSAADRRPALLVLDDGLGDDAVHVARNRLRGKAEVRDIRFCQIIHHDGSEIERYASLLQTGWFAAAYLEVGLGSDSAER
ncbi:SIS domain-containing protein [Granulicoccus sp. GXG6511]|uniref:SIS domain-containing protein n=1 Tax=Granulicoccus sp. GXG6511 TaxID=3381351 RepID=UPI003D7DEB28